MPRAIDGGGALPLDRNPLARISHSVPKVEFDIEAMIAQLANFVEEYLIPIIEELTGLDLTVLKAIIDGLVDTIGAIVAALNMVGNPANWINFFSQLVSFIPDVLSSIGSLFAGLFGMGAPTVRPRTIFVAGRFPDADSLVGNDIWTWDSTVTRNAGTGSAKVIADGTLKALRGARITVSQGTKVQPSIFVRWVGYSGSGAPFQLQLVKFNEDEQTGIVTVDTHTPPGSSSSGLWAELAGTYPVEANVTHVVPRLVVTATAAAGTIHFDDGGYYIKPNLRSNLAQWFDIDEDGLAGDPDAFDPTDLIPVPLRGWIESFFGGLDNDTPTDTLTWAEILDSAMDAFHHVPNANVLGHRGPANVGDTFQEFLDQLVGGMVGEIGDDAAYSDVFNISNIISQWASRGRDAFDIAGIRSNKNLGSGFLPTSESTLSLSALSITAADVPVTQAVSAIDFHRWSESGQFGVVGWQGYGNTSITAFYVNIWKMDTTTGDLELVHRSPNIIGDITGGSVYVPHLYEFVDADITRQATEVFAAELTVVGAGTHHVKGGVSDLGDQLVYPRKFAATRDSGTGDPPDDIASIDVDYSDNVPFIEFGVEAGETAIPVSTEPLKFSIPGVEDTTPVPSYANFVDIVPLGGGRGGEASATFAAGVGGDNGDWNPVTLEVGVDIKPGSVITVNVGDGGNGGPIGGSGGVGEDTVVTYIDMSDVEQTITATGGSGPSGTGHIGGTPGDVTVAGRLYRGGGAAVSSVGSAPGGGGGGGQSFSNGKKGAPGAVWVTARQT